jgi:hypothetical protein
LTRPSSFFPITPFGSESVDGRIESGHDESGALPSECSSRHRFIERHLYQKLPMIVTNRSRLLHGFYSFAG